MLVTYEEFEQVGIVFTDSSISTCSYNGYTSTEIKIYHDFDGLTLSCRSLITCTICFCIFWYCMLCVYVCMYNVRVCVCVCVCVCVRERERKRERERERE